MIVYLQGKGIFTTLFRIHGSALYKGIIPASFSTCILLLLAYTCDDISYNIEERWFTHPYPIAAMIAAFTFLLTFKLSFSYNRYWEACTSIHQMHSKWLDVGIELAAWHLQSEKYAHIFPPAFGSYPELESVERRREKSMSITPQELEDMLEGIAENDEDLQDDDAHLILPSRSMKKSLWRRLKLRRKKKSLARSCSQNGNTTKSINAEKSIRSFAVYDGESKSITSLRKRTPFTERSGISRIHSVAKLDGGMDDEKAPSLFLQEASHLLSLLSAVAFTTLRSDLQKAPAPLAEYVAGSPWPSVDPDANDGENHYQMSSFFVALNYLLGNVRTDTQRTVYNSCRPIKVLGGVSDSEIEMLQRARGPVAKLALVSLWLQEFISREFEHKALGKTAPPIVSRLYQFVSDGTLGYNQARKVAFIPFPFPHTQLTTFYVTILTIYLPILMLTFIRELWVSAVMNFFCVGVFLGIWFVSIELEDPFRNVPNDLPLNNMQAQFNEALLVMFAGFHPESWWTMGENKNSISAQDLDMNLASIAETPVKEEAEPKEENGSERKVSFQKEE